MTVRTRLIVLAAAAVFLVPGLWAFAWPHSFHREVALFDPFNLHLVHDLGAFQLGLGAALLGAILWRDAVFVALVGASVGATAHAVAHVVDRDLGGRAGDPWWLGVLALALIAAVARRRADREPVGPTPPSSHRLSRPRWAPAPLQSPTQNGFVLVGADTGTWRLPPALPNRRRRAVLHRLSDGAEALLRDERVIRADVFSALVRPPGGPARDVDGASPARFDAVLLVEVRSTAEASEMVSGPALTGLARDLGEQAANVIVLAASNPRRIAPVSHDRPGVFLFNYFSASDVSSTLAAWEHTSGWFHHVTGLDNSTVLEPLRSTPVPYTVLNHCRWEHLRDVLPDLLFRPSFRSFVLRTFSEHSVTPRPLLYRCWSSHTTRDRRPTLEAAVGSPPSNRVRGGSRRANAVLEDRGA